MALGTTTSEVVLLLGQRKLATHVVVVFWVVTHAPALVCLCWYVECTRVCSSGYHLSVYSSVYQVWLGLSPESPSRNRVALDVRGLWSC